MSNSSAGGSRSGGSRSRGSGTGSADARMGGAAPQRLPPSGLRMQPALGGTAGRMSRGRPPGIELGFPSGAMAADTPRRRLSAILRQYPYTFAVILPTLLTALYLFFYATPQYISESRFQIKTQSSMTATLGMELMGGRSGIGSSESENAVRDHLLSHDALRAVRERMDLIAVFRPPHADIYSRLWWSNPSAERLLDHFRHQVQVVPDAYTGIVTLTARTYSPAQSQELARSLLEIGEEWVTRVNQRMLDETLRASREVVERAERRVTEVAAAVTEFRQRELALNPTRSAELAVGTIGGLESEATRLRSELQQAQAFTRPNAPLIQNLRSRIAAIEVQIREERARLSNADQGVTQQVAGFERLVLEQDLANRGLAAAMAGLETATANAQRQQIFLQRVVEPNYAERSLYPKPVLFTGYVFAGLSLVYGLLWLLVAGVREHAS
ncbi:capsule biosynthesis protein [Roseococcus thiosulfatophilus]|uniref:capsule biosynthesis protein n=1 Tax=Roseococcus thiosulfatophilus TaxID=35813 RepID=UPI001A8CAE62|nr:capsule biosynthesis protein [Roseococcus thiosulfatophilus]